MRCPFCDYVYLLPEKEMDDYCHMIYASCGKFPRVSFGEIVESDNSKDSVINYPEIPVS